MKILPYKSLLLIGLMFLASNFLASQACADVIKPLIASVRADSYSGAQPTIAGVQAAGTDVLIFINNIFFGEASTQSSGNQTDNFYFYLDESLRAGNNYIQAAARDRSSGKISERSEVYVYPVKAVATPLLIAPDFQKPSSNPRPVITGLTNSGTKIRFWIDNVYNGETDFVFHSSGTANFFYRPFLNLTPGRHFVSAQAIDADGARGGLSEPKEIIVEYPLPAPVILGVVENLNFSGQKVFQIIGLAKNDLDVKIYIDRLERGSFRVVNNPSGTANFHFQSSALLRPGRHLIYAETVDRREKVSPWSAPYIFTRQESPLITTEAASSTYAESWPAAEETVILQEEKISAPEKDQADKEKTAYAGSGSGSPEEFLAPKTFNTSTDQELAELVNKVNKPLDKSQVEEARARKAQSRLRVNLLIFIGFLLAVIGWVIWVNRTLIKERQNKS